MSHTIHGKKKLLARVRRIKGCLLYTSDAADDSVYV